jgi:hypothetical protein
MRFLPSLVTLEAVKVAYEATVLDDLDRCLGFDWDWPPTLKAQGIWFRRTAGATRNVHDEPFAILNLLSPNRTRNKPFGLGH